MNIILKDSDIVIDCLGIGLMKILQKLNTHIIMPELTFCDFSQLEKIKVTGLLEKKYLELYPINEEAEIKEITKIFNSHKNIISASDANAIFLGIKINSSIIINNNGAFNNICKEYEVKTRNYDWFINFLIDKQKTFKIKNQSV